MSNVSGKIDTYGDGLSINVNLELVAEGLRGAEVYPGRKETVRIGVEWQWYLLLARGRVRALLRLVVLAACMAF